MITLVHITHCLEYALLIKVRVEGGVIEEFSPNVTN